MSQSQGQALKSAIYEGTVFHRRNAPKAHGFKYGVYSLLIDLDELEALSRTIWGFAANKFAPFAFHNRDHGDRTGSDLVQWCKATLDDQGIQLDRPRFRVLCFPRVLGFTFDPISTWFCYEQGEGQNETLAAIIYEVHNTFGTDHSYVVDVRNEITSAKQAALNHSRTKQLHVSPFFDTTGGYDFRLKPIGQRYHLNIRYLDDQGAVRLIADHQANRIPLTSANLWSMFWRKPLVTLKVVAGIHWEALHLFSRKNARYHHPSPTPSTPSSATPFSA